MASTAERLQKLIADNLEVDGQPISVPDDLNVSLMGAGVSSTDLVAFAKVVAQEFGIKFTPEHCTQLNSVREVADYIDGQAS